LAKTSAKQTPELETSLATTFADVAIGLPRQLGLLQRHWLRSNANIAEQIVKTRLNTDFCYRK
jgi:hypothetical protein